MADLVAYPQPAEFVAFPQGGVPGGAANQPPTVEIDQGASASVERGKTLQLTATKSDPDGDAVTLAWASSAPAVATVSSAGKVTGIAEGSCSITVTASDGTATATDSILITVTAPAPPDGGEIPPPPAGAVGPVVNGVDLASLGLVVDDDLSGWLDSVTGAVPMRSVPGRGRVAIGAATPEVRRCGLSGWIRPGAAGSDVDALLLLLSRDALEITLPGHTGRVYRARTASVEVAPYDRPVLKNAASGTLRVRVGFECTDPYAYAVATTTVDFGAATAMPLGTAPVRPTITLGGVTNPVLVYRDGAGVERGRLVLTGTFSAANPLVIDCAACTLRRADGTNAAGALSSGDFLTFDPRHGTPTLEVSPVPSGIARAEYARAYRSL